MIKRWPKQNKPARIWKDFVLISNYLETIIWQGVKRERGTHEIKHTETLFEHNQYNPVTKLMKKRTICIT